MHLFMGIWLRVPAWLDLLIEVTRQNRNIHLFDVCITLFCLESTIETECNKLVKFLD